METNIRYIRKQEKMTLEELSEKTGLTAAYLSMIERGKREPTLSTLMKIATVLKVTTESLWTTIATPQASVSEEAYTTVRSEEKNLKTLYPGVEYASLTTNTLVDGRGVGMISHFGRLLPGGDTNPGETATHEEDELTFMLTGTMRCIVGAKEVILNAGDTLLIKRGVAHKFVNDSNETAEYLLVRYVQ